MHHPTWLLTCGPAAKAPPRDSGRAARAEVEPENGGGVCGVPHGHGWARIKEGWATGEQRSVLKCLDRRNWRWLDCRKVCWWSHGRCRCKGRGCRWAVSERWHISQLDWSPPSGAGGAAGPSLEGRRRPSQLQMLSGSSDLPHYHGPKVDYLISLGGQICCGNVIIWSNDPEIELKKHKAFSTEGWFLHGTDPEDGEDTGLHWVYPGVERMFSLSPAMSVRLLRYSVWSQTCRKTWRMKRRVRAELLKSRM